MPALGGINSATTVALESTALTIIPQSTIGAYNGNSSVTLSSNTTAYVGQVCIPYKITVNKITFKSGGVVTTAGTFDVSMYSEDGQTQLFSVTTASVSSTLTLVTTAVSAVALQPGIYYIMINTNSTTNAQVYMYSTNSVPFTGGTSMLAEDVTGEPIMTGTITITADTPPANFDPTAITAGTANTLIFRLDN